MVLNSLEQPWLVLSNVIFERDELCLDVIFELHAEALTKFGDF